MSTIYEKRVLDLELRVARIERVLGLKGDPVQNARDCPETHVIYATPDAEAICPRCGFRCGDHRRP